MGKSKKKQRRSEKTQLEILQSMRGDWGNVNPVPRIIPNKKKNPKIKHKGKEHEE